jgi:hypothetical protein
MSLRPSADRGLWASSIQRFLYLNVVAAKGEENNDVRPVPAPNGGEGGTEPARFGCFYTLRTVTPAFRLSSLLR